MELVDTPDLKSVDHYSRAGSSPATPIFTVNPVIIDCFSYKIFKTNLNFTYREKLKNIIKNLPCDKNMEDANSKTTNAKILDVVYDDTRFEEDNINLINILSHQIGEKLNLFSKLINFDRDLEISNLWCVSYKDTEKCVPHIHNNDRDYCFSGIYYLSFDSNNHQTTTFFNDESLSESFTPKCDEDDLLIYPADVWHGYSGTVPLENRIVVPFDVKVKSKIKYY